jgi:DNA primase
MPGICPSDGHSALRAPERRVRRWERIPARLGRPKLSPDRYTIRNLFRRVSRKPDPWAEIDAHARSLAAAARRLELLR